MVILFLAICLGHFYIDSMFGIWPLWKTLAGYNIAEAGLMTGLAVFLGEGLQTFFGKLSDRGFMKKLIVTGLCLSSISLLYPFASFPFACLFFFLTCVSSASFHPSAVSAVAHIPLYSMPCMMGIFQASGFLGVALGQKIFISLFSHSHYATLLLLFLPLLLGLFFYRTRMSNPEVHHEPLSLIKVLSTFWKKPLLQSLYLLLVMNQAVFWALLFLLPEVVAEKGMSEWFRLGGGTLLFVIGAASTCIPLGLLAARLHIVRLLPSLFGSAVILVSFFLFSSSWGDPWLLFLLGGMLGAITPLALALGAQCEPKKRGMVSAYLMGGVWIVSESMGYAFGSLLYSWMPAPKATHTLQLFALFLVGGIMLANRLKKQFYESHEANAMSADD